MAVRCEDSGGAPAFGFCLSVVEIFFGELAILYADVQLMYYSISVRLLGIFRVAKYLGSSRNYPATLTVPSPLKGLIPTQSRLRKAAYSDEH